MTDDILDEIEMAHRARVRAETERDQLRAELDTFAAVHRQKTDQLALEIRRLRAAEAPGTDDAALEGTGWEVLCGSDWFRSPVHLWEDQSRLWVATNAGSGVRITGGHQFALDAMRAAVPGSV